MGLPSADDLSHRLLGRTPDRVRTLFERPDRAVYVVTIGGEEFVCKVAVDDDAAMARDADGQRRAYAAGLPVPEVIATADGEIASRFVSGTALVGLRTRDAWRAAGRVLRRVNALEPDGMWGEGLDTPRPTWRAHVEVDVEAGIEVCTRAFGFDPAQARRIRDALAASSALDAPMLAWCHGDCQPDHMLIDPATDDVVAIIDWSDHGKADAAWDLAVLTLNDEWAVPAVFDGYEPDARERAHLDAALPLLRVGRWLGEAHWLFTHGYPYDVSLARALEWRPSL